MVALIAALAGLPPVPASLDRRVAISSEGRVASTVPGGTYVAGLGRVAGGGNGLAWSPDGKTLAISIKRPETRYSDSGEAFTYEFDDVAFWPSGPHLNHTYGLQRPLAWSPNGDRIAGSQAGSVTGVFAMADGHPLQSFGPNPAQVGWTEDGRLFAATRRGIYFDNRLVAQEEKALLVDAVPTLRGAVWLEVDSAGMDAGKSPSLDEAKRLRLGRWVSAEGTTTLLPLGTAGSLLAPTSDRKLVLPTVVRLAPDGQSGAAAGLVIEGAPSQIARLRALLSMTALNAPSSAEVARLLRTATKRNVVTRFAAGGRVEDLWSGLTPVLDDRVTDLGFSPDGCWLAIALRNGTVRVRIDR